MLEAEKYSNHHQQSVGLGRLFYGFAFWYSF